MKWNYVHFIREMKRAEIVEIKVNGKAKNVLCYKRDVMSDDTEIVSGIGKR